VKYAGPWRPNEVGVAGIIAIIAERRSADGRLDDYRMESIAQ